MSKFVIVTQYRFTGAYEVEAKSVEDAKKIVAEKCNMTCGLLTITNSTLTKKVKGIFDGQPEQVIISTKNGRLPKGSY